MDEPVDAAFQGITEEDRFRLLVETVKDYAIFLLDPSGRVSSWNAGAERLKGYTAEEIIGRHFSTFYPEEDRKARKPEHELEVVEAEGRIEDEGWRVRKDGSRFWANVVITALRDKQGKLVGYAKVTRDLTERREREEKLRLALEEVRRSNVELEEYAAFVSHDLQEPLRKMSSFAELVVRRYADKLDDDGKKFLGYIVDGAVRLRGLITDVLEYARIGKLKPEMEKLGLEPILAQVIADLEVAIKEAGAEVSVAPLPAVHGNDVLLQRVFMNLIGNALKFRHASRPPKIVVSVEESAAEIVVSVKDNGIGFEPKFRERIMSPFKRLHPKEKYPGSGLGLATVKRIAELHGGRVWASSSPDRGSEFFVALPKVAE